MSDSLRARRLYLSTLREAQKGTSEKASIAAKLLRASTLGSHEATYALATWYIHGVHFKKNLVKGTALLKRAARAGNADACYDLAVSYDNALGVLHDPQRAFELYLESAMRGDADACQQVARCFWTGQGIKKNRTLADLWMMEYDRLSNEGSKKNGKNNSEQKARRVKP